MIEQENAIYEDQLWCVYELKDENGVYKDDLRLFMRMESQKRKLICPECQRPLILCAGPIREPYLKHYDLGECVVRTNGSGTVARTARALLFQLAKRSFPEGDIQCNRAFGKYITDVFLSTGETKIALEYLSSDMKLEDWAKKHTYYEERGIADLWFLSGSRYGKEKHTTFEYLVSRVKREYQVLDVKEKNVQIKELYLAYPEKSVHPISKEYDLQSLTLTVEGRFSCDFYTYRDQYVEELLQERKVTEIRRRTEGEGEICRNTFEMTSIYEWWDLPGLLGEAAEVQKAKERRRQYLKTIDVQLEYQEDPDVKMDLVEEALRRVNGRRMAKQWL